MYLAARPESTLTMGPQVTGGYRKKIGHFAVTQSVTHAPEGAA